jgi:hypothetical protein
MKLTSERRKANEALCPHFHDHTPTPEGYLQWHAWARKMSRTHRQERCSGCGLYAIWVPRKPLAKEPSNG